MTALPMQTPYGVVHQAITPLDFTPISTVKDRKPPVWEGDWEGVQILLLLEADFNGVDRAFAICLSQNPATPGSIHVWELTTDGQFENEGTTSEARVQWQVETPDFEWTDITKLKKLISAELWVDRIFGTVEFFMEYRPDSESCWKPWARWKECVARNCLDAETPGCPAAYPTPYNEGFKATMTLPKPPEGCASATGRPSFIGYQFQFRLTVTGFCRIRGLWFHAEPRERKLYENLVCDMKEFCYQLWRMIT
jgi:hypothetical protein